MPDPIDRAEAGIDVVGASAKDMGLNQDHMFDDGIEAVFVRNTSDLWFRVDLLFHEQHGEKRLMGNQSSASAENERCQNAMGRRGFDSRNNNHVMDLLVPSHLVLVQPGESKRINLHYGGHENFEVIATAKCDTCAMQMTMPAPSESMLANPSSAYTALDSEAHSAALLDSSMLNAGEAGTEAGASNDEQLIHVLEDVFLEEMD
ncbi:hypothetical protein AK812_SmicGene18511 [Symbiodinium microadriaticum]|uniref:Uncharacterized protein n=1 Tax=Symbiodinium microadriaticum TaxID=2951 RepID=A0A1Q9DV34_SYMMI|nr:hypothetical protein AK812_SmicGene18511 [Symbiodinium microadriaticum]